MIFLVFFTFVNFPRLHVNFLLCETGRQWTDARESNAMILEKMTCQKFASSILHDATHSPLATDIMNRANLSYFTHPPLKACAYNDSILPDAALIIPHSETENAKLALSLS